MRNVNFKSALINCVAVFVVAFFLISFSSCKKAKDTIGVIIVKDSNGLTVPGAYVILHQDSLISPQGNYTNPELRKTNYTDANGRAEFTYEREAVLNVEVEKKEGNSVYTGSSIIRLLKGKTETKIVEIN